MRAQHGFSFIELLIAIAIILVISAIAIPGLLHSHVAANESQAVSTLRQIDIAQSAYSTAYGNGYAAALALLGPPVETTKVSSNSAGMLDRQLGCASQPCIRAGYGFEVDAPKIRPVRSYRTVAMPLRPGISGGRGFCDDQSHRLMFDPDGQTNCHDSVQ
jgi:prepilin-type N-terminal cleavage/methylation domain-containing protein